MRSDDSEEAKEYKNKEGNRLLIELVHMVLEPGALKKRVQTLNSGFVWS